MESRLVNYIKKTPDLILVALLGSVIFGYLGFAGGAIGEVILNELDYSDKQLKDAGLVSGAGHTIGGAGVATQAFLADNYLDLTNAPLSYKCCFILNLVLLFPPLAGALGNLISSSLMENDDIASISLGESALASSIGDTIVYLSLYILYRSLCHILPSNREAYERIQQGLEFQTYYGDEYPEPEEENAIHEAAVELEAPEVNHHEVGYLIPTTHSMLFQLPTPAANGGTVLDLMRIINSVKNPR